MTTKLIMRYHSVSASLKSYQCLLTDYSQQNKQHKYVVRKPGLGLQLGHMPKEGSRFPLLFMEHNYENGWRAATLLIRESCMLKLVDTLSDKPDWWLKVRDPDITNKWKQEALAMDWKLYREYADFTPAMADAVSLKNSYHHDLYSDAYIHSVSASCERKQTCMKKRA